MIKIKEAVIVEGKYDKIKLSNILDAFIIETNGFQIYKDSARKDFIKRLADEQGIIVLTDSDHSGFQLRNYISMGIPKDKIKHLYIPDVYGKEKRKTEPSKEGKLGVEGMDDKILIKLFENANVEFIEAENKELLTNYDLFAAGISGGLNSKEKRKLLLKKLNLPEFLSTNSLLTYLNSSVSKKDFFELADTL
ncbi:MAG: DUF4093 domain-containing protein [Eubacterium sp.]|nr:DUF4093 domain-containing protein [Eubacterium sp.]